MKLRHKLWGAFAAFSLLLVLLGVISVNFNRIIVRSFAGGEEHFRSIVESAIHVSDEGILAESYILSFLMSDEPPNRSNFLKTEESLRGRLDNLDQTVEVPAARTVLNDTRAAVQRLSSTSALLLDRYDQAWKNGEKFNLQRYAAQVRALDDAAEAVREGGIKLSRIETDFLNKQAAISAATEVITYARKMYSHLTLYLLLGDNSDRDKFLQKHASLQEQIAILDERTTSPEGVAVIDDLKTGANELLAAGNSLLQAFDRETEAGNIWSAANYGALVQKFSSSVDWVANDGLKLTEINIALEIQPKETAAQIAKNLEIAVLMFTIISVGLSLGLAFIIARSIAKPVAELNVAVGQIARGEMDVTVNVKSKDEIGQLSNSFNTMARALHSSKAELVAAKDYTEQIIKSMDDALVVMGVDSLIQSVNPSACRLLGRAEHDLVGQPVTSIIGEGMAVLLEDVTEAAQSEPKTALINVLRQAIKGPIRFIISLSVESPIELEVTAFPINVGLEQKSVGMLMRDVTKERDLERRRYQFISIASHELRTPMTAILGFSELLLHRDPPEATRKDWLERIYRESHRLASLVNNILNVFSVQSGKQTVDIERIRVEGPIEDALSKVKPNTQKHEFIMDIAPGIPGVMADKEKLVQVLTNLLDNAVKFSPDGGRIIISTYHEPERKRVVLAISDQGIGISPRDSELIFSAFSRIYRPETGNIGGTGLGLFIVKGLIELMRGEVWVQSEKGKGSTFFVALQTDEQV